MTITYTSLGKCMLRFKNERDDTRLFPPRQVNLNTTKVKEMWKIIKQEQEKT